MGLDWRVKYYGTQVASFLGSGALIAGGLVGYWALESPWALWASLPMGAACGGIGWAIARRFSPYNARHLSPREWEELRSALEDVPVLSVFHLFAVDRSRLEKFKYIPLLQRYLWECLAEEPVDPARVARAAFLLHTFQIDLKEYEEALELVDDALVRAWLQDLLREKGEVRKREQLRHHQGELPRLVQALAETPKEEERGRKGVVDASMEAAWRLALFGPLARQHLRSGLEHRDPRVREACLALLEIIRDWPERHGDLVSRMQRDVHPSVQQAAMELLAVEGRKAVPALKELAEDPFLGARAQELIQDIEANR